jgi:hypothetical protein
MITVATDTRYGGLYGFSLKPCREFVLRNRAPLDTVGRVALVANEMGMPMTGINQRAKGKLGRAGLVLDSMNDTVFFEDRKVAIQGGFIRRGTEFLFEVRIGQCPFRLPEAGQHFNPERRFAQSFLPEKFGIFHEMNVQFYTWNQKGFQASAFSII